MQTYSPSVPHLSIALFYCGCCLVIELCPTLCNSMDCSMPGFPVLHYLPKYDQTHVHELMMTSNHLVFCCPLLLLPSIFPSSSVGFSHQLSSVIQSCPTLCSPTDCSMLGFPVHHQFPEPAQTHVHGVGDAIQPSHPLSSPYPTAFNLLQHQGLIQWVSSLHKVAKVLEFQLQHQSFQWIFSTDFL